MTGDVYNFILGVVAAASAAVSDDEIVHTYDLPVTMKYRWRKAMSNFRGQLVGIAWAGLLVLVMSCVPMRATSQTAPDAAWCRNVQTRGWTLSAATQGIGALSASLAVTAATQDGDRALGLNLVGAVVAAIGVATAHLGSQHASAYAEQCGPLPHQKEDTR